MKTGERTAARRRASRHRRGPATRPISPAAREVQRWYCVHRFLTNGLATPAPHSEVPSRRDRIGRVVFCMLPLAAVLGTVVLYRLWQPGYWGIVGEDRLAEWLTFAAYLIAGGLALVLARALRAWDRRPDAALMALVALASGFIAGEEVSWFQRQLDFEGPAALIERNNQGEANLHNMLGHHPLHASFIVVGLYGAFGARMLVPKLPLLRDRPWLYVPPAALAGWFCCAWVYYAWAEYLNPLLVRIFGASVDIYRLTGPKLQELVEFVLAGAIVVFLLRLVLSRDPVGHVLPTRRVHGGPATRDAVGRTDHVEA